MDHKIEVKPGSKPPSKAPYHLSQKELEELKSQLDELLAKGYIRQSKLSYDALVLFVDKDWKLRICTDYRAFNKVTVKNDQGAKFVPWVGELLLQVRAGLRQNRQVVIGPLEEIGVENMR